MNLLFTGLGITSVGIDFVTDREYDVPDADAKYLLEMFPEVFTEVKGTKTAPKAKVEETTEAVEAKPAKK